ncbi:Holliday junction resolvase RuvX [Rhodoluna sp.]|uniref:Holliday junction resolvase RuvX n=1 Tax=Rhodoluna sp. TaxID=1969481 RepID=UPI0025D4870A|nr:Holliday junction resolvase RuvX [Rhodoluna sp.]
MLSGRRLAVDVGTVRVGLAISDFHAILGSGLGNAMRKASLEESCSEVIRILDDVEPVVAYVGLPLSMSGNASASTQDAIDFGQALSGRLSCEVRFIDERLTTVSAASALRSSGKSSKSGRKIIDQIAATIILEQALQIERSTGKFAGKTFEELDV